MPADKKLHSLQNQQAPLALLQNCAWDMNLLRILDDLSQADLQPAPDLYLPHVLTFDQDIADMLRMTALRAMALHLPSRASFPLFQQDLRKTIPAQLGDVRTDAMAMLFGPEGMAERASRRTGLDVQALLLEERHTPHSPTKKATILPIVGQHHQHRAQNLVMMMGKSLR